MTDLAMIKAERMQKTVTEPDPKCCCGHARDRHVPYANGGANARGCRLVCTADGCRAWMYCDLQMPATSGDDVVLLAPNT